MKVSIGDYSAEAEAAYAIVKENDGTYTLVEKLQDWPIGSQVEAKNMRDYAMCEIADWLDSKGVTKAQAIHVFAEAVLG